MKKNRTVTVTIHIDALVALLSEGRSDTASAARETLERMAEIGDHGVSTRGGVCRLMHAAMAIHRGVSELEVPWLV